MKIERPQCDHEHDFQYCHGPVAVIYGSSLFSLWLFQVRIAVYPLEEECSSVI